MSDGVIGDYLSLDAAHAFLGELVKRPMVYPALEWRHRAQQVRETLERHGEATPGWLLEATGTPLEKAEKPPAGRGRRGQPGKDEGGDEPPENPHHLLNQDVHFDHPHTGKPHRGTVKAVGHRGVTVHDGEGGIHKIHHGDYGRKAGRDLADPDPGAEDGQRRGPGAAGGRGGAGAGGRPADKPGGHLDGPDDERDEQRHQALVKAWKYLKLQGRPELRVVAAAALLADKLEKKTHNAPPEKVARAVALLQPRQLQFSGQGVHIGNYDLTLPGALTAALHHLAESSGSPTARMFTYEEHGGAGVHLTPQRILAFLKDGT